MTAGDATRPVPRGAGMSYNPRQQTNIFPKGSNKSKSGDTYSNSNTTTFPTLLGRQAVRRSQVGSPVASADGQDGQFGDDDGGADRGGDFFGCLDSQTHVALRVADDNDSLETCALTGSGLLLHGFDL